MEVSVAVAATEAADEEVVSAAAEEEEEEIEDVEAGAEGLQSAVVEEAPKAARNSFSYVHTFPQQIALLLLLKVLHAEKAYLAWRILLC